MKTLIMPELGITAKQIFELCISNISNVELRLNLLANAYKVEEDTNTFINSIPDNIHRIKKYDSLENGISIDNMKDIYTNKFAAKESPGRRYYDLILCAPKGSICPICGERPIKNLDHYMPKSVYSTLAVTPENLIPTCRDCNFDKHKYVSLLPEEAPLHPYFDNVNEEVWLCVKLLPNQIALYEAEGPKCWSEVLRKRLKNHLSIYELDIFYALKASQVISSELSYWKEIVLCSSQKDLSNYFVSYCKNIEKHDLNSWKAALFRAFISQFDVVLSWLE